MSAFRMIQSFRAGNNGGIADAAREFGATGNMSGFPEAARGPLGIIAGAIETFGERGMNVDEAVELIATAAAEGRDLTEDEVDNYLAGTDAIADRVEDKLAALEARHAKKSAPE